MEAANSEELVLVKRVGSDVLAVKQKVDREAMEAWGKRQYKPFQPIPPLKSERWPAAPLHAFRSQLRQLIP
jgi:hypothetical protein